MPDFNPARRRLLRGRNPAAPPPLRPPWARSQAFTDLCTRCGDCVAACGDGPLVAGEDRFPETDFARAECSFCAACADVCPAPVFLPRDLPPWQLTARIGEGCLAAGGTYCRSCGDACPELAIRFAIRQGGSAEAEVVEEDCTGCGACVAVCPVGVVRVVAPMERKGRAHEG